MLFLNAIVGAIIVILLVYKYKLLTTAKDTLSAAVART